MIISTWQRCWRSRHRSRLENPAHSLAVASYGLLISPQEGRFSLYTDVVTDTQSATRRILVVDDQSIIRSLLEEVLAQKGYTVITASNGKDALEAVRQGGLPDLAVLDIMLPGMDGFAVANQLENFGDIPIIFLSALTDLSTKVEGLSKYAEEYVTKPFSNTELVARIQRILARTPARASSAPGEVVIDDNLRINFEIRFAVLNGEKVRLTPIESELLRVLYSYRGQVVLFETLIEEVWGADSQPSLKSLQIHISRLRTKIEPSPDIPRYIVTVHDQGYVMPYQTG